MATTIAPLFAWKDEYSIHNVQVDVQHQKLVRLLNTLYEEMIAGKGNQHLGETLGELVRYTQEHFHSEEGLMQQSQYPGYKLHKQSHEDLCRQVAEFQAKLRGGRVTLSVDLLQFLKSWLQHHIQGADQEFGRYLASKGR